MNHSLRITPSILRNSRSNTGANNNNNKMVEKLQYSGSTLAVQRGLTSSDLHLSGLK